MKFNLSNDIDKERFNHRIEVLIKNESFVELKKINPKRSISLNSYFHVVVSLYAIHFGYTLYESKIDLKRMCPFMTYEKKGKKYLVQTSKQDSKELSQFVDWIRNMSAQNGCYIPDAKEYLLDKYGIDREIDNSKAYL